MDAPDAREGLHLGEVDATLSECYGCTRRTTNKPAQSASEEARERRRMSWSGPSQLGSSGSMLRCCEAEAKSARSELVSCMLF